MPLTGFSLPDTLTDDAGNTLKGVTVAVTGPNAYVGTATSDAVSGAFQLGPLPEGDYTIALGARTFKVPVRATTADIVADIEGRASSTYVPFDLHAPLDIWDEFNANGGIAGSWAALSYTDWMTGVDALLAGQVASGKVVRTDHGPGSDAERIYSFTAGLGKQSVLLIGGLHPDEMIGQYAFMRAFQQFVTGTDPFSVWLRNNLRIVWIPTAVPGRYRVSRKNDNEIDCNRNFAFYHTYYVPPDAQRAKGAAPFDQPETAIIKAIVDADPSIRVLVDGHGLGEQTETVMYFAASPWVLSHRRVAYDAAERWKVTYGQTGDVIGDLLPSTGPPVAVSWFEWYARQELGRLNAAALGIEAPVNVRGSSASVITRGAMQVYNGLLMSFLVQWLLAGQQSPRPLPITWLANVKHPDATASTTPIASGGNQVSSATFSPVRWGVLNPYISAAALDREYVEVVVPCDGIIDISVDGYVENQASAAGRIDVRVTDNEVEIDRSFTSVTVPATFGARAGFATSVALTVTANAATLAAPRRIGVRVALGSGTTTLALLRLRMKITFTPNEQPNPVPIITSS